MYYELVEDGVWFFTPKIRMEKLYRIMVVDDEPEILELFQLHIKREDIDVITFSSPNAALAALRKEYWDVLVTDIMMPEMDGFSLIHHAAHIEQKIPCIVITAYGTDEVLKKALESDCFGYLHKPFDWNYVNLLVDKAIKASRRLRRQSGKTWNLQAKKY
jgi:DNA-binding NtrC family response regulator